MGESISEFSKVTPEFIYIVLPRWCSGKESICQCRRCKKMRALFLGREDSLGVGRKWQPTAVFLLGKPHGQRSLVGYSPWGHKRVGHNQATEQSTKHIYIYTHTHMHIYLDENKISDKCKIDLVLFT